jgi:hypothetical protein
MSEIRKKNALNKIQYSGELNIFHNYLYYIFKQDKDDFDWIMLKTFERLVAGVNDLYRYTITKDKVLRESRWNEWVQIINKEE